jgi:hypothetical protein
MRLICLKHRNLAISEGVQTSGTVVRLDPDFFPELKTPGRWRLRGEYESNGDLSSSFCAVSPALGPATDSHPSLQSLAGSGIEQYLMDRSRSICEIIKDEQITARFWELLAKTLSKATA